MATYIMIRDPEQSKHEGPDLDEAVSTTERGQAFPYRWAIGSRRQWAVGDRVFLLNQGSCVSETGIIGSGRVSDPVPRAGSFNGKAKEFVGIQPHRAAAPQRGRRL